MRHDRLSPPVPARTTCRYVLSVTAGANTVEQGCPNLEWAEVAFDLFKEREADNRDAHGGIYDRQTRSYVGPLWRGGPKPKPLPTLDSIFARLIARGEPVSVIGPRGAAHFNTAQIERKDAK
jgi:hypothetical protein